MKTVGIIAEYNPFHSGHAYHITEAKRMTGADCAAVVMSGDFVQRGNPAIFDKYTRTQSALLSGADFVFELPVYFATSSAEFFAFGAVSMLTALGVDYLCFGSECDDIEAINEIAEVLYKEPALFKEVLAAQLKAGNSFPVAREKALCACFKGRKAITEIIREPNNLLAIEYCKALKKLQAVGKTVPEPISVKRLGNYNDDILPLYTAGEDKYPSNPCFASASAIRKKIERCGLRDVEKNVPREAFEIYSAYLARYKAVTADSLSQILAYKLLTSDKESLSLLSDWNEELANRIKTIDSHGSFTATAEAFKSKNLTLTRANRMLLSVVLGSSSEVLKNAVDEGGAFYARLLGMREDASASLKTLKKHSALPIINRLAPAEKELEGTSKALLQADIRAAKLYEIISASKEPDEYRRGLVRV